MGRGVRTVQRWEAELRLPVHRVGSERGSVFAFRAELDNWLRVQGAEANPCTPTNEAQARGRQNALRALDKSNRLATETLRVTPEAEGTDSADHGAIATAGSPGTEDWKMGQSAGRYGRGCRLNCFTPACGRAQGLHALALQNTSNAFARILF